MRKLLLVIPVVLLLAAGGAYYGLMIYPDQNFRANLDQWSKQLPPGFTGTYHDAHYDWFSHRATIGQIAVTATDPAPLQITVDQIAISDPSPDFMTSLQAAMTQSTPVAPDTVLAVASRISYQGFTVHSPQLDGKAGPVSIDGVKVYPATIAGTKFPTAAALQAAIVAANDSQSVAPLMPMIRLEAAWMSALSYGHIVGENLDITVKVPAIGTTPASTVTETLRKMEFAGYDRGAMGAFSMEGLDVHMDPGIIETVGRATLGAMDFRKLLPALAKAETLTPDMLDGLAIGRLEYQDMTVKVPKSPPIKIGDIALSDIAFSGVVPISGKFSVTGFHIPRAALAAAPGGTDGFDKLGLKALTVSMGLSYSWDLAQHRITIKDNFLKADELGSVTLAADLTDMAPGPGWETRGALAGATVHYEDASLVRRALKASAGENGDDPAAERKQVIAQIKQQAATLGNDPVITATTQALIEFVRAPKTLTVTLAPPKPVAFTQLDDAKTLAPPQIAALLGFSLAANQ